MGSKVAVITGASAGVGRACVRAFAEDGYDVGLLARGETGLKAAADEVHDLGRKAVIHRVDVADAAAVEAAADHIELELGPIDVWVNNAMAAVFSPFLDMTPAEFDRVVTVTFLGQVNGVRAAVSRMKPRDSGTVVQVGSALAYRGIPLQSAYCASKHAIQGFLDSVRAELLHDDSNVRLSMVQLPAINTPQFDIQRNKMARKPQPVPPIYQPEVAAKAILAAARTQRREIWAGLPTVRTIVGNRLFPDALDRLLAEDGYSSQQRDESADPDAPDVLFEPIDSDLGAHGSFDQEARENSTQLDLNVFPPLALARTLVREPLTRLIVAGLRRLP